MKKLLVFFMVMFGISLGAMAGEYGSLMENGKRVGPCILKPDAKEDGPYAVYFATDWDDPTDECKDWFNNLRDELAELESNGGVAYYVMIASADGQGNTDYNRDLSARRYQYVADRIIPSGISADRLRQQEGWTAGDAASYAFEPVKINNPKYRSVYIYPVWARFECDAELVRDIDNNITKLKNAKKAYPGKSGEIDKILTNYNKAYSLCNEAGKKLGAGDAKKLSKYLSDAFGLVIGLGLDIGITNITISTTDIDTHYYNLTKMISGLKLSVWRDEKGNFNTARLVSDSIAGVVLGTVGGIVTSKLVKKNQLKKGFEDLSCTVAGQNVAGYGDDFTVGLR